MLSSAPNLWGSARDCVYKKRGGDHRKSNRLGKSISECQSTILQLKVKFWAAECHTVKSHFRPLTVICDRFWGQIRESRAILHLGDLSKVSADPIYFFHTFTLGKFTVRMVVRYSRTRPSTGTMLHVVRYRAMAFDWEINWSRVGIKHGGGKILWDHIWNF